MRVRDLRKPLIRGHVWHMWFDPWEEPGRRIKKYGLILQEGTYFLSYNSVSVILLTTTPAKRKYPTDVIIPPEVHGASEEVRADCSLVYTIPVQDLIEYAYALPADMVEEMDTALALGLGLARPGLDE